MFVFIFATSDSVGRSVEEEFGSDVIEAHCYVVDIG